MPEQPPPGGGEAAEAATLDVEARQRRSKRELMANFWASAISGGSMNVLLNPVDTLRVRWQTSSAMPADGSRGGGTQGGLRPFLRGLLRQEGLLRGLWAPGVGANGLFTFTVMGAKLGTYPLARDSLSLALGQEEKSGTVMLVAGFGTGAFGYAIATPFFQIKTRLQSEAGRVGSDGLLETGARAGSERSYRHTADALSKIVRTEGVRGLWRGGGVVVVRGSLNNAGYTFGYDYTKTVCLGRGWMQEGPALHLVAACNAAVRPPPPASSHSLTAAALLLPSSLAAALLLLNLWGASRCS